MTCKPRKEKNAVQKKSKTEYDALIEGAKILEQDGFGIKVMRLPGDRILKLFRRRRKFSSQIWAPHAERFAQNARMLTQRGIPTITIEATFRLPHLDRQAVLYQALPGETLRDWLVEHPGPQAVAMIEAFGQFVSKLHAKGIHFRSLHLGNVLVTTNDKLALIDIVDMGFRWFGPLFTAQRIRNIHHIARYKKDCELLASQGNEPFIKSYLEASSLKQGDGERIKRTYLKLFPNPQV